MFAPLTRFLTRRRRRRTGYRPYSCPYVGGPTRYATGERPPVAPYGIRGVGLGSLGLAGEGDRK